LSDSVAGFGPYPVEEYHHGGLPFYPHHGNCIDCWLLAAAVRKRYGGRSLPDGAKGWVLDLLQAHLHDQGALI